jgi:hypothetical protein
MFGIVQYCSFMAVLYIAYGSLWLRWLSDLRPSEAVGMRNVKCSEIGVTRSSVLYAVAWVQLVCTVLICVGFIVQCAIKAAGDGAAPASLPAHRMALILLTMAITVTIASLQILYIRDIRSSQRTVAEDCTTPQNRTYRNFAFAFAIYFIFKGVGLGYVGYLGYKGYVG